MSWSETAFWAVVAIIFIGWLLWISASRIDRLHRKVISSRLALETQLVRRASAALELATSGELDPASSILLADAATHVLADDAGAQALLDALPELAPELESDPRSASHLLDGLDRERAQGESALSATLRSILDEDAEIEELKSSPVGAELLSTVTATWFRAQLARRFHNEAVAQAQRMRRKWHVRVFRLAGRAPMPATVEFDDAWPPTLTAAGVGR